MNKCKRCNKEYSIKMVSKDYINKYPEKYEYCSYCRKYKFCKNCGKEFHHKQNESCSIKCANELKEKSYLISCGAKHNFYKESSSRKDWEKEILEKEGITNIFQRNDVKDKIKKVILKKYGYYNVSKSNIIKVKKKDTLLKTIKNNPSFYKNNWWKNHNIFMEELGYDPRLHIFGKASQESLLVFKKLIKWCINEGINDNDIYIGYENKNEYFIRFEDKIYFYDFTIRSKKIIIEFNGICFHSKIINENWKNPFTNETSIEEINKRTLKNKVAKENGFKILEIWSDILPDNNIEMCKKFIYEN